MAKAPPGFRFVINQATKDWELFDARAEEFAAMNTTQSYTTDQMVADLLIIARDEFNSVADRLKAYEVSLDVLRVAMEMHDRGYKEAD